MLVLECRCPADFSSKLSEWKKDSFIKTVTCHNHLLPPTGVTSRLCMWPSFPEGGNGDVTDVTQSDQQKGNNVTCRKSHWRIPSLFTESSGRTSYVMFIETSYLLRNGPVWCSIIICTCESFSIIDPPDSSVIQMIKKHTQCLKRNNGNM